MTMNACFTPCRFFSWFVVAALWLVPLGSLFAQPANPAAQGPFGLDDAFDRDPVLVGSDVQVVFHPRLIELWTLALQRPDMETRRQAALAIARAYTQGHAEMRAVAPRLRSMLEQAAHPLLRQTLVQTLAALEDHDAAPLFLNFAAQPHADPALLALVDLSLARWNILPARSLWLARMKDSTLPWPARYQAITALGHVGEEEAAEYLRNWTLDPAAEPGQRLVAAGALANIQTAGLVPLAGALAEKPAMIDRLLAAELLRHHREVGAVALLQRLAADGEPAVAQRAADRLLALTPADFPQALAATLLDRDDAGLRMAAVKALLGHLSPESAALAATALGDVNAAVRRRARQGLAELAPEHGLREVVVKAAGTMLAGDRWQGLEQAAYLLGALDDKSAAPRMVELLRHLRPEVRLAACVGLRRLQAPQTLAQALSRLEELHRLYRNETAMETYGDLGEFHAQLSIGAESSQLYQLLGIMKYTPAEPLMRRVIPKNSYDNRARASAIWALGLLHEDDPDQTLIAPLTARLSDVASMDPEDTPVRMMSAVSLGRIKAQAALPALRRFMQEESTSREIGGACRWAIARITGQEPPPPPTVTAPNLDWFLTPLP